MREFFDQFTELFTSPMRMFCVGALCSVISTSLNTTYDWLLNFGLIELQGVAHTILWKFAVYSLNLSTPFIVVAGIVWLIRSWK